MNSSTPDNSKLAALNNGRLYHQHRVQRKTNQTFNSRPTIRRHCPPPVQRIGAMSIACSGWTLLRLVAPDTNAFSTSARSNCAWSPPVSGSRESR